MDGSFSPPGGGSSDTPAQDSAGVSSGWVWAAVSAAVLLAVIAFAAVYRKQN